MTGKRTSDDPARSAKPGVTKADKAKSEGGPAKALQTDTPAAAAKASVHEAIGKLIGDDAERERGAAEKEATEIETDNSRKPARPK